MGQSLLKQNIIHHHVRLACDLSREQVNLSTTGGDACYKLVKAWDSYFEQVLLTEVSGAHHVYAELQLRWDELLMKDSEFVSNPVVREYCKRMERLGFAVYTL